MMEIADQRLVSHDKWFWVKHVFCWIFFIAYETYIAKNIDGHYSKLWYYVLFYALNIGLFYSHSLLVMKHFNITSLFSFLLFLMILTAEIIIYTIGAVLISLFLDFGLHLWPDKHVSFDSQYFSVLFYRAILFLAFGTGYFFIRTSFKQLKSEKQKIIENERLRYELLQSQTDYLRAQINPHLLFNTLSFIKISSVHEPEKSEEALEILRKIMDYAMDRDSDKIVPVKYEAKQIELLVKLNQLRFQSNLLLKCNLNIQDKEVRIIPLVLLTLVENMFKHGDLLNKEYLAKIDLLVTDKLIIFKTSNATTNSAGEKSNRTGLKNVKERLNRAYAGRFYFETYSEENAFRTELSIKL